MYFWSIALYFRYVFFVHSSVLDHQMECFVDSCTSFRIETNNSLQKIICRYNTIQVHICNNVLEHPANTRFVLSENYLILIPISSKKFLYTLNSQSYHHIKMQNSPYFAATTQFYTIFSIFYLDQNQTVYTCVSTS